jgi:hypothetical protein
MPADFKSNSGSMFSSVRDSLGRHEGVVQCVQYQGRGLYIFNERTAAATCIIIVNITEAVQGSGHPVVKLAKGF